MSGRWDPEQYLRFEDERSRPFADLLARVPHPKPSSVVDLGCGPGNMTAKLLEQWPEAKVLGLDSSAEMIERAQENAVPGRLDFVLQDLRDWKPDQPVDVIVTAATLHWVPDHLPLVRRFMASLAPGGVFAFQVPGNFRQPSHTLLEELAGSDQWRELLAPAMSQIPSAPEPEQYLDVMLPEGTRADVWETTYLHVLTGPDPVLQWISGTGMRPVLAALDASGDATSREEFLKTYAALLRAAYPRDAEDRTIFPFRRIFGVGVV
jgi:trans-aconitate 2-methyltransferase